MHLYLYFGMVGILSIAAWAAAVLTILNYVRQPRRLGYYSRALGLAVIGWLLAAWNSHNIGLIEIDRTQELKLAYEQQRQIRIEDGGLGYDLSADARFAEDGALDALDLAGIKGDDKQNIYEKAVRKDSWAERRAKRKREAKLGASEFDAMLKDTVIGEEGDKATYRAVRKLPALDVIRADRLDMINRWSALVVFYLCLFLIVWEYMRWFNRTVGFYLPLPLAGHLIDALSTKRHSAVFMEKDDAWDRRFLEDIVAKGETFIYAGPRDPLPGAVVSRVAAPIRRAAEKVVRWPVVRRLLRFLPFRSKAAEHWRLPKLTYAPSPAGVHETFAFESAWFGRYAFTMPAAECRAMVTALIDFLKQRLQTRARANRTVHVVLRAYDSVSESAVQQLAFLARETNFKAVWLAPQPQVQRLAGLVEEVCPDQAVPVHRSTYMAVVARWCRVLAKTLMAAFMKYRATLREHRKIRLEKAKAHEQAKLEAKARAEAEAKAAAQAKAEAEAKARAEAAAQAKAEAEAKARAESEAQAAAKAQAEATAQARAEAEAKARAAAEAKAQPELKPKAVKEAPSVPSAAPRKVVPFIKERHEKAPPQSFKPVIRKAPEQPAAEAEAQPAPKPKIAPLRPKVASVPAPAPQAPPPAPPPKAPPPPEQPAPQRPVEGDAVTVLYDEGIVKFYCRNCRQKLSAALSMGGTQINCPVCNTQLTIPAAPPRPGA